MRVRIIDTDAPVSEEVREMSVTDFHRLKDLEKPYVNRSLVTEELRAEVRAIFTRSPLVDPDIPFVVMYE